MMFEIYRSRQNHNHYVAIAKDDSRDCPANIRESQNLEFLIDVPDDGQPRIAFNPNEAKGRIERTGFYAFNVKIDVRESVDLRR